MITEWITTCLALIGFAYVCLVFANIVYAIYSLREKPKNNQNATLSEQRSGSIKYMAAVVELTESSTIKEQVK